jgi:hypothetical protein
MTTESTTITIPSTLIEQWVERTGLSWARVTVAVALVLMLLLVGAAYLDGVLAAPFDADLWRRAMGHPATVVFTLLILPGLSRLRDGAIEAIRPCCMVDDDFRPLVAKASIFSQRRQWLAVGIGAVAGLLLERPWPYPSFWLTLYGLLSMGLMYGLAGWFTYSSLAGTRLFTELHARPRELGVLELESLEPIAHWSLGIALSYVGGITLGLLFTPQLVPNFETVMAYGILTLAPLLVFFLNMKSTHDIMVQDKSRELKTVTDSLAAASQALKQRAAKGETEGLGDLSGLVATWLAYEERVKAVPEWPYTAVIRRNLLASTLLPAAVGISRTVLLDLLPQLLSSP